MIEAISKKLEAFPGHHVQSHAARRGRGGRGRDRAQERLAVKIFGPDLAVLETKGNEIKRVLEGVRGLDHVTVVQELGQPSLTVTVDRAKIARYGLNVADINGLITAAVGGQAATQVVQGEKLFDLVVRLEPRFRETPEAIGNILVATPGGQQIPLKEFADIRLASGASFIYREDNSRYIGVQYSVEGRDLAGAVEDGQRQVAARVTLPAGYRVVWGGEYEEYRASRRQLAVVLPLTLFLIFLLLFALYSNLKFPMITVLAVLLSAPVGGLLALKLTGTPFSVSSGIGFLALFGVSVQTAVIFISYANELRRGGTGIAEATREAALLRLRPIMMTALVAASGLLPAARLDRNRLRLPAAVRPGHRRRAVLAAPDQRVPDAGALRDRRPAQRSPGGLPPRHPRGRCTRSCSRNGGDMPHALEAIVKFLDPSWVIPVFVVAGLAWFTYSKWKTAEGVKELAREMGITFSTGADELLGLLGREQAPPLQDAGPSSLAHFLGLFSSWRLHGKVDGVTVSVFQFKEGQTASDTNKQRYTSLRATIDPPLGSAWPVQRRPGANPLALLEKIAEKLVGRSEARPEALSSNEALNEKVVIHATALEEARKLFADAAVQDQVLRAMELGGHVTIDDAGRQRGNGSGLRTSGEDPVHAQRLVRNRGLLANTVGTLDPARSQARGKRSVSATAGHSWPGKDPYADQEGAHGFEGFQLFLVGEAAVAGAREGEQLIAHPRLRQRLVQPNGVRVRHQLVGVPVDGQDRGQSRTHVGER